MNCLVVTWPEPIVRVQSLSDSGITAIPKQYIKTPSDRPSPPLASPASELHIPVIDLQNLLSGDPSLRATTLGHVASACREWGFFQVVNHGVSHALMTRIREVWYRFFHLPAEEKQRYANAPATYEGYGSRVGVEKGAELDWCDYFYLHLLPLSIRDPNKWPIIPSECRELIEEYGEEVGKLCANLMKILSLNLGLSEDYLQNCFGGEDHGTCMRVNYYPKCPQPDLTLGLSAHSDPGGLTLLLPDEHVSGLQVRRGNEWFTVNSVPNAFIVNIGDQIQVLSNAIYKSVDHRVVVNPNKERVSIAFFYNPKGDILIQPAKELISETSPALYRPMTFDEYRLFIRTRGPSGKSQVDSLQPP